MPHYHQLLVAYRRRLDIHTADHTAVPASTTSSCSTYSYIYVPAAEDRGTDSSIEAPNNRDSIQQAYKRADMLEQQHNNNTRPRAAMATPQQHSDITWVWSPTTCRRAHQRCSETGLFIVERVKASIVLTILVLVKSVGQSRRQTAVSWHLPTAHLGLFDIPFLRSCPESREELLCLSQLRHY